MLVVPFQHPRKEVPCISQIKENTMEDILSYFELGDTSGNFTQVVAW